MVTQFPMGTLEKLGLLKMDFLGLKYLSIIGEAVLIINRNLKLDLDIDQLPWTMSLPTGFSPPEKPQVSFSWRARGCGMSLGAATR